LIGRIRLKRRQCRGRTVLAANGGTVQQIMKQCAQTVNIRTRIALPVALLFRRREARRPKQERILTAALLEQPGDAEVDNRTWPERSIMTLDGFRSRWMMGGDCPCI
jgi:hypothetical protein